MKLNKKNSVINNSSARIIFVYLLTIIGAFILMLTLSTTFSYRNELRATSDSMYRQTTNISSTYGNDFFKSTESFSPDSDNINVDETTLVSLNTIARNGNVRLFIISSSGDVCYDSDILGDSATTTTYKPLYKIENFDSTALGGNHTWVNDFYKVFDEKTVSVFSPITNDYTTCGYVIMSVPNRTVQSIAFTNIWGYIILFLIGVGISVIYLIYYIVSIQNPLTYISQAIETYKKGEFEVPFSPNSSGEVGRLETSLADMAAKIKSNDEYQQQFLANVSHDFRSPLTSIIGYLVAMQDGTIPPELSGKYIDRVLFEAERLKELTEDIITLNELDPNAIKLSYSDFDINLVIKHIIETFEGQCRKKNITFNLNFCSDKTFIHADESKYQQIIYNLVDNAIKFSQNGGKIIISISTDDNNKAIISIEDQGVGISEDDLPKIWNRFYKTDASRGLEKKSSGLGLSIVKGVIGAHGEDIKVKSTLGKGTVFTFTATLSDKDNFNPENIVH